MDTEGSHVGEITELLLLLAGKFRIRESALCLLLSGSISFGCSASSSQCNLQHGRFLSRSCSKVLLYPLGDGSTTATRLLCLEV